MLFAAFSSQCERSTPTSLQSPFPSLHATFLALAWQALVHDLLNTPVVRYSLSHHLCALFNVCYQALDCASALDRVCRLQPLYLLMAARHTSIITTTAPPAPTLATNVETESIVFPAPAVVFTTRFEQHQSTITSSLARVIRARAATIAPRKVVAGTIASLLTQNLRAKITRILFRATANHVELSLT